MKTAEICCSKTSVNFGRCYGNQGWAETVETKCLFWNLVHLRSQKNSTLQLKAFLRNFRKFTWGGGAQCAPPPALNRVKNKLARKPDDTKHRVVKKNSRCTIEPKQSFPVWKKSKQRRWSGHDCTSHVVVGWVDCQVLGHSKNSNCSAVRGVDCEHHRTEKS